MHAPGFRQRDRLQQAGGDVLGALPALGDGAAVVLRARNGWQRQQNNHQPADRRKGAAQLAKGRDGRHVTIVTAVGKDFVAL